MRIASELLLLSLLVALQVEAVPRPAPPTPQPTQPCDHSDCVGQPDPYGLPGLHDCCDYNKDGMSVCIASSPRNNQLFKITDQKTSGIYVQGFYDILELQEPLVRCTTACTSDSDCEGLNSRSKCCGSVFDLDDKQCRVPRDCPSECSSHADCDQGCVPHPYFGYSELAPGCCAKEVGRQVDSAKGWCVMASEKSCAAESCTNGTDCNVFELEECRAGTCVNPNTGTTKTRSYQIRSEETTDYLKIFDLTSCKSNTDCHKFRYRPCCNTMGNCDACNEDLSCSSHADCQKFPQTSNKFCRLTCCADGQCVAEDDEKCQPSCHGGTRCGEMVTRVFCNSTDSTCHNSPRAHNYDPDKIGDYKNTVLSTFLLTYNGAGAESGGQESGGQANSYLTGVKREIDAVLDLHRVVGYASLLLLVPSMLLFGLNFLLCTRLHPGASLSMHRMPLAPRSFLFKGSFLLVLNTACFSLKNFVLGTKKALNSAAFQLASQAAPMLLDVLSFTLYSALFAVIVVTWAEIVCSANNKRVPCLLRGCTVFCLFLCSSVLDLGFNFVSIGGMGNGKLQKQAAISASAVRSVIGSATLLAFCSYGCQLYRSLSQGNFKSRHSRKIFGYTLTLCLFLVLTASIGLVYQLAVFDDKGNFGLFIAHGQSLAAIYEAGHAAGYAVVLILLRGTLRAAQKKEATRLSSQSGGSSAFGTKARRNRKSVGVGSKGSAWSNSSGFSQAQRSARTVQVRPSSREIADSQQLKRVDDVLDNELVEEIEMTDI